MPTTHPRASRAHHRIPPLKVNHLVKVNKLADLHSEPTAAQEVSQTGVTLGKAGTKLMEATLQITNAIGVRTALREGLLEDTHPETNSQMALQSSKMDVILLWVSRLSPFLSRLLSLKTTRIMTPYARKYPITPYSSTNL